MIGVHILKAGTKMTPTVVPEAEIVKYFDVDRASVEAIEACWNEVKNLKPYLTIKKKREDNEFLVVLSSKLELFFLNQPGKNFFSRINRYKKAEEIIQEFLCCNESCVNEFNLKKFIYQLKQYGLIKFRAEGLAYLKGVWMEE